MDTKIIPFLKNDLSLKDDDKILGSVFSVYYNIVKDSGNIPYKKLLGITSKTDYYFNQEFPNSISNLHIDELREILFIMKDWEDKYNSIKKLTIEEYYKRIGVTRKTDNADGKVPRYSSVAGELYTFHNFY